MNINFTRSTCRVVRTSSLIFVSLALGLLVFSGCSGFGGASTAWMTPSWGKNPDEVAKGPLGIKAPYLRMAELRNLEKQASSMSADEQQRAGRSVAEQYRTEDDPLIRAQMVRTLTPFKIDASTAVLREAMNDESIDVRIAACGAWGLRKGPEAVELLGERVANDENVDVRLAAARALGETGDQNAVKKLAVALDDADPALQVRAALSLRKLTGKEFDKDINQWRQYVKGETPTPSKPTSVAGRIRQWF